jgi:putative glutamine amidotransferase
MHPVIGIPCHEYYQAESDQTIYGNKNTYVQAVENAGGLPILIPTLIDLSKLENLLPRLDGLLFTGGMDIQPGFYGEQPQPALRAVDPQLDAFEAALATWALQRDMPILGICRGMQLINVVLGGTLHQDISDQHPGSLQHCRLDLPRTELVHQVIIDQESLMKKILNTRRLVVNSLHHQAVKEPGKGVRICGRADDGTPELLEVFHRRFVLGIQCHPEDIYREVPAFARLFQTFIHICSEPSPDRVALFHVGQAFQVLQPASAA